MLAPDHPLGIVPEDDLRVGVVFRLQDVDGLVGVDGPEAALRQLLGKACAHHAGAVQTQDGIYGGVVDKAANQLMGTILGF